MRVAFVSKDSRLVAELENYFDLVVSDRDNLESRVDIEFHDLGHDEEEILSLFEERGVSTAVCLGYRRLFSGKFIERCSTELYNLHPSLLPAFKGLDVYSRIIDRGVRVSGATLHRVSEEMDEGEVIDQVSYRVDEGMTVEELKMKAKKYEVELFRRNLV